MNTAQILQFPLDNFNKKITRSDLESWRNAGYKAIDQRVNSLAEKFDGNEDFEAMSEILIPESKEVTAAIFEKIINTMGKGELNQKSCICPRCNKLLKYPKSARRTIETQYGKIALQRPYFHCGGCRLGTIPFDKKLGFAPTYKQYDLQKKAASILAEVPYERAAQLFKQLTGCEMSDHAMHDLSCNLSEASEIAQILPTKFAVEKIIEENAGGGKKKPILVISADGAHLPTRPESNSRSFKRGAGEWKEAKGFRIYLIGGDERIIQIMSWHQIATQEEFGEALNFASTLIPKEKVRIALVADGAHWIWKHFSTIFPDGRAILDYYHCSENVHKAAEKIYLKDEEKQKIWIESIMARLNAGEVHSVIWGLQRTQVKTSEAKNALEKLITYLGNHADKIDYKKLKKAKYPRGSGGIESANKFICHVRMKRSGAWWYIINGNDMLRLRCSIFNGTFDQVFNKYKALHKEI